MDPSSTRMTHATEMKRNSENGIENLANQGYIECSPIQVTYYGHVSSFRAT